ncbi:MAG: ATP-binding cassette domain-containing protein [Blastocatellia bacterium]|nr:ATP-binding cassette domain-containing protein [Blastocatellia bacterium]
MTNDMPCVSGPLAEKPEILGALLTVENVGKSFQLEDGALFPVLKGCSFQIHDLKGKPQIISLLGPSGVGKTTLLRMLAGLDAPSEGTILITDGTPDQMRPVRVGDIGVVFQKYPLFEDLKVIENLIEPPVRRGMLTRSVAREKAERYLQDFDLMSHALAWPRQLSGGQRQRVAILQQLMLERYFIILDEPFSGLDPVSINNAISLLSKIAHQHEYNTFIIITHDVTSALIISDHVYLIGRDRDESGEPIPGARVQKEYDMIAEGLAYRPDVEDLPRFAEIRKEIKLVEFPKL